MRGDGLADVLADEEVVRGSDREVVGVEETGGVVRFEDQPQPVLLRVELPDLAELGRSSRRAVEVDPVVTEPASLRALEEGRAQRLSL